MTHQISVLTEIDEFLTDRCQSAQRRIEDAKPDLLRAIAYNDRLAANWEPGIKTRSVGLEQHELDRFMAMARSEWLAGRRHPSRPTGRALIIDLGAGNGKVVDWIAALVEELPWEVSYIFTDISSKMMESARARFDAMKADHPDAQVCGHFTLADITEPMFSSEDWARLREVFFPIITVCAGGTIGNFGEQDSSDDSAQDLVFNHYVRPADAALVTFLDPQKIKTSLKAYASSGLNSGMYDGQMVNAYVLSGGDVRLVDSWTVPFNGNGTTDAAMSEVIRAADGMSDKPFWLKMDMIREGKKVGQVTRHYSEKYAKKRFLGSASILEIESNGRAYTVTFGDDSPPDL